MSERVYLEPWSLPSNFPLRKTLPPPSQKAFDAEITRFAQAMLDEGRKTFRYKTFGSEVFWGDALQLHKAIAGAKNGGVGPGVSPKTALSVGLKVDVDALPDALKAQTTRGSRYLMYFRL